MTKVHAATLRTLSRFLAQRAASAVKCGRPQLAERFERWRGVIAAVLAEQPRGCAGCWYEGEEVNRCMTCACMTWRTDKFTKTEVRG